MPNTITSDTTLAELEMTLAGDGLRVRLGDDRWEASVDGTWWGNGATLPEAIASALSSRASRPRTVP